MHKTCGKPRLIDDEADEAVRQFCLRNKLTSLKNYLVVLMSNLRNLSPGRGNPPPGKVMVLLRWRACRRRDIWTNIRTQWLVGMV